jgi:hypothetical protein
MQRRGPKGSEGFDMIFTKSWKSLYCVNCPIFVKKRTNLPVSLQLVNRQAGKIKAAKFLAVLLLCKPAKCNSQAQTTFLCTCHCCLQSCDHYSPNILRPSVLFLRNLIITAFHSNNYKNKPDCPCLATVNRLPPVCPPSAGEPASLNPLKSEYLWLLID